MTDDDRWRENEPPPRGPSTPSDLRFNPVATAIGVFAAVAVPIIVFGYSRAGGGGGTYVVLAILIGVIVGVAAGLWVAHRDGYVWRGPRL